MQDPPFFTKLILKTNVSQ